MTLRRRRVLLVVLAALHATLLSGIPALAYSIPDTSTPLTAVVAMACWILILTESSFVPLWVRLGPGPWLWRLVTLAGFVAAVWLLSLVAESAELDRVVVGIAIVALGTAHWAARVGISIEMVDSPESGKMTRAPIQFSIAGLLLLTCLVAVAVQAFRTIQPSEVIVCLSMIGSSTIVCWLATWAALGQSPGTRRLLSIAGLAIVAVSWHFSTLPFVGWTLGASFAIIVGTLVVLRTCGYRLTVGNCPATTIE
ncbi:MAG TPA: hypothetical protein VGG64_18300 [Pirellulales bacterium]|jgi:hypothetical protein